MTTRELLDVYYAAFAGKSGWDSVIAEDFQFTGGGMRNSEPITGKQAYLEIGTRFSKLFTGMRVKEMIVEGDKAFVLAQYDYEFPKGEKITGNVAELWHAKNGKLTALTIFFDTKAFFDLTH